MSWGGYIPGHLLQGMDPAKVEALLQDTDFYPVPMVHTDEPIPKAVPFETVPPRDNLIWAAVDLDGTLAEGVWTPDNPTSEIGPMKVYPSGKSARDLVDELYEAGYKVVVHTARGYTDYENIERWLRHNKIRFRHIICGKVLAAVYIDDRNKDINDESWVPGR
jgi:hypothetical protein